MVTIKNIVHGQIVMLFHGQQLVKLYDWQVFKPASRPRACSVSEVRRACTMPNDSHDVKTNKNQLENFDRLMTCNLSASCTAPGAVDIGASHVRCSVKNVYSVDQRNVIFIYIYAKPVDCEAPLPVAVPILTWMREMFIL